ncbi:hypothetical protein SAMN05216353_10461 [Halobacillus alkaliphilus]|uniref:Uncharacterized protein n=1 Tax=Halobacillus alkaliphilus TaxID=396056 RepID=A0A1I2KE99_9BACI|nr:hypothetical protein [Halobacillus alkaliphilus]SFF64629.1 hypothetical protein SAMN05216353_10461 [Halobacillus alkaliphilus]
MLKKSSGISILISGVSLGLALILVLFYSQPNLPTFAIFLFTLVTGLIGMIFGIVGLIKDKGMLKLLSTVSVLVGLGYLVFLAVFIVTGDIFGT